MYEDVFIGERLTPPEGGSLAGPFNVQEAIDARREASDRSFRNAPVQKIGDWKLASLGPTISTWVRSKADRDSDPRKLTDGPITLPANAATSAVSSSFYKERLDSVRADRVYCAKTGKGCDKGNEGNVFTAMSRELGKTATTVGKVLDPKTLLDEIPGINKISQYLPAAPNPTKMAADLVDAAVHGDLERIKNSALEIGHLVANVVSMVPGVGNVIGGPLSAAITLLETGSPLKAVLALLLNEIPGIPPQIRDILRVAFYAIADIVEGDKSVTDIVLYQFKEGVREQAKKNGVSGPIMDIVESALDAAIQVIFQSKPLDKAALDLAEEGLAVARKNVAEGVALPKEITEAEKTLSDLKEVYDDVNDTYKLSQDIIKLAKQDPKKQNAAVQRQIRDLRASVERKKPGKQAKGKKFKKAAPKLRSDLPPTYKPPAARPPPKLRSDLPPTYRPPTPAPAPKTPAKAPAAVTPLMRPRTAMPAQTKAPAYGPYPPMQAAGVVNAPPRGGGGGRGGGHRGGHHGGHHHGGRPFPQRAYVKNWDWPVAWWNVPWTPEVVTRTETCQTWGDAIEMPHAMQNAAKTALGASKGRPTSVRGPDNVLYLFSYENGALTARPCAAVATSA